MSLTFKVGRPRDRAAAFEPVSAFPISDLGQVHKQETRRSAPRHNKPACFPSQAEFATPRLAFVQGASRLPSAGWLTAVHSQPVSASTAKAVAASLI